MMVPRPRARGTEDKPTLRTAPAGWVIDTTAGPFGV